MAITSWRAESSRVRSIGRASIEVSPLGRPRCVPNVLTGIKSAMSRSPPLIERPSGESTPITRHGYYNDYRNYELYLTQRGTEGRTPDIYDADLHLGYDLRLGPTTVNLGLDVFSLFNTQRTTQVDERYDSTEGGAKQANYLQPIAFTPRRSMRLAARVSF